jgi:hypothetical protein
MQRRTVAIISTAALAVAAGITGLVIWLTQPSYDDIVEGCAKALAAQAKTDKTGKPAACKDVKDDDYAALALSNALDGLGWTDENGDFDESKMLDDVTEP